jgi:predicted secreted protein
MGWTSGIVVYVIAWWLVFFMMLPIGVRPPHEAGEELETGQEPGAPVNPMLWRKALAATVIAAALWGLIYWAIVSDLVSFRGG